MPRFSTRINRIGTHILVSTLALAAANVANAQVTGGGNSYDAGDPVVVSGNVTFDRTGTANTEIYTINSNTAVLDFIPNAIGPGGPIPFQFQGTVAQYLGGLGITDFTVLNRILAADPSRAIQLNGTIISRLQAFPTTPGGSVWFYSPGGIIVGSAAVIDVGNLLLATGDPTGGSGVIGNPNQFTINSVPDANAAVHVQAGAQITASNAGSYIALVAPSIIQSGTVNTNGSAAYVAAEQTTLTFNSGLFNIQTTVGSNAGNNTPLIHDGTTRFIDDSGQRRAYLVSVAKNDAITMLIEGSGQLGFDMATGVNIDNGVVVLSGGFDVADTAYTNLAGTAAAFRHDIQITSPTNNANFQGQVNPFAASEIRINALGQAQSFAGDVSMNGGSLASLTTQLGGSIDIVGDLDLSTLVYGARDTDIFGGNVVIDASLGNISIGGNTSLTSFTDANLLSGIDPAGTVHGGNILVIADNGNAINMLGNLDVFVRANGADQLLASQTSAGNAVGGNVLFASLTGSTLSIGGIANIANIADGGLVQFGNASAGNAMGGAVDISAADGNIIFGSDLSLSATGTGGQVNASGTTAAGNGTGGQINFSVGSGDLTVGGSLAADVSGRGGSTQFATSRNGGTGTGGDIVMSLADGGSINVANNVFLNADGFGSTAVGTGNDGGSGTGGDIQVLAFNGTMDFGGNVALNAFGRGASGSDNVGIVAQGGTLALQAAGGNITIAGNLDMFAQGIANIANSGEDGANGIGGSASASALNNGSLNISGAAVVSASAVGGAANGGVNGRGGDALGGNVQFIATNNGIITIGQGATASAVGIGGNGLIAGTNGGDGSGGTASISQDTGGLVQISVPTGQSAVITTDGIGGESAGGGGTGGSGTGGDSRFVSNDGTIVLNGDLFVSAQGQGGASDGISGGDGTGGLANIEADTGLTRVTGNATIRSAGLGGTGIGTGTDGGLGIGGQSLIGSIGTGAIDLQGSVNFNDNSNGGTAVSGTGGNGTAGLSQIFATAGTVNIGGLVFFATRGFGGNGLNGGIGNGGRASIFADSAGTINFTDQVFMSVHGRGGQSDGTGNIGGFGQGGVAEVFAHGTINIVGDYNADSGGSGGDGANGADGGDALGGIGSIIADGGVIRFDGATRTRGTTLGGDVISGDGSGGDAQGGLAEMIARNGGNLQLLGVTGFGVDANVATSALGGDGLFGSGSGGNAIGGTSNVFAESGGTINIAGGLLVTASGFAGNYFFDPANQYADLGGDGTGGTVNIFANGGNIIGTSDVAAVTNGHGGLGVVNGGNGTGGTVNVQAIDGLLDFASGTGTMFLSMSGFGGDAVTETDGAGNILRGGGNGGDGIGGTILLLAGLNGAGNGSTGILRIGDLEISENAIPALGLSGVGGAGAAGAAGQDGGDGGDAVAGVIRIGTNNGSSQFTAGNITVGNQAIGGIGGDGENGGDGGDAAGRQTAIGTFNEIGANTGGSMTVGNIDINGSAMGGNGGAGLNGTGGIGGDSLVGPPALLTSQASAYLVARPNIFTFGDALLTMDSTGGDGGIGTAGRAAGGTAAGFGTAIIVTGATDGVGFGQAVGNSFVGRAVSTGGLGAGDIRAASNRGFSVLSAFGGSITLANATMIDGGLAAHQNGVFSAIESGNGFVLVTGLADVDVDGDFGLLGYAGGDVELENLNVVAGGTILFDDPNAPGSATPDAITVNQNAIAVLDGDFTIAEDIIIGGVFDLTAAGSINTLGITAGSGITLRSGSTITTGNLLSIGNISITGMADEILGLPASILTGSITSQTGLINVVTNIGDITLGNLTSPNAITIIAGNGSTNANAGGDIVVSAVQGSDLGITGMDNLTIGNINVADTLTLNVVGSINAGSLSAGNSIALNAGGTITTTGDVMTASFTAASGADLMLGGGVTASQQATLAASGLASFGGLVSAPSIVVISSDIAIGASGGLGSANTNDLEINAVAPDQPIFFGGNGSGGGYNLSAAEATKLRSRTIRFNAPQVSGAAPADITVGDFTLQGSLAGSNANLLASELIINSSGNIRVTGAARIENAGAEDSLFLTANDRIEVVTDLGGNIAIVDNTGALGGNLYLDASHIAVGTADLLGRLATDPRFAGRDAEVNAPDGSNRPEGYIAANRIQVDGFDTIIIQNSGTDILRGGFSAGSGGFILDTENMTTGSVDAVINGRIADGSGGFLTNDDALHAVSFEDPAEAVLFSPGSTVNGCLLNGGSCPGGTPIIADQPNTIASDVREISHESEESSDSENDDEERAVELTPEAKGKKSPIAPNVPVVNTQRLNSSPIIADPITGSGNPNFISGDLGTENSAPLGVNGEGGQ